MFQQQPLDFRTVSISFYTVHVKKYKYKKLLYLQRDPKSFLKFIMSCPDSHYLIKNLYICTKIHYIIISLYISLYHNRFLTDFLKKYEELTKKKTSSKSYWKTIWKIIWSSISFQMIWIVVTTIFVSKSYNFDRNRFSTVKFDVIRRNWTRKPLWSFSKQLVIWKQ